MSSASIRLLAGLSIFFLLAVSLMPGHPPRPAHRSTGPQSSSAVLGVHGRLTDEVEAWKVERSVDMVAEMGAGWLVEYFPWAYMEPEKGRYDWRHSDMVIAAAAARGLRVVARVDMVPDWARPAGTSSRYLDEERFGDYSEFVAAFAQRYSSTVSDLVVWNEPNLAFEWGFRPVDPASYVALLRESYGAIKAAAPAMSVVAAGLAPTLDQGEWGLNDLVYLERMYQEGAGPYFDKLAVHSYGWRSPPDDPASPDRVNFARAELARQVMVDNGDAGKKVLITEAGWNDHPRWSKAVRPAQRVEHSLRALEKVEEEWPWVDALCFWSFRLPKDARNYNDYFTFVSVDFTPKPIYQAFQQRVGVQPPGAQPVVQGRP